MWKALALPSLSLVLVPATIHAQSVSKPAEPERPAAQLENMIFKMVTAKLPEVHEDASGWGHTIPLPERVRAPRLRRTIIEVDGRPEVPDGTWRKVRLRIPDPARNLNIHVKNMEKVDLTNYRLKVDADVNLQVDADVQRWRNGILLADVDAHARVGLKVVVDCDIAARLDTAGLQLEPDIKGLKLILRHLTPSRVTLRRAGVTLAGESLEAAAQEFKDHLQEVLRAKEPDITKRANEALKRAMRKDKDPLAAAAWIKAAAPLLRAADSQTPTKEPKPSPPPPPEPIEPPPVPDAR
jgi:hypothetical protein